MHRIEAGMPAVSPADAEAIKEIVKRNLGSEIFAFARCMKEDVKRAVDTGVKGIVTEIPSSEHIIKYVYRWSLKRAIDLSIEATQYAKEQGLYVVFFPIDSSRAEMSWYLNLSDFGMGVANTILALSEEMVFSNNGTLLTSSLSNYLIPTAVDMPEIEVIIVDNYDPTGPFGAKGVGEPTSVPTAAVILNAIYDAVGVRLYSLPATPEKVLKALQEKQSQHNVAPSTH
ncbi:MAG: hypothetical protein ACUVWB_10915 [Anaerolineae bacterium]